MRDPVFLANLAELLRAAGQDERGIACCREAIAKNPRLPSAYHNLAALLERTGRLDEAVAAARQGVALAPSDANSHRILAAVLTTLGKYDEALAEFDRALRLNPNDSSAWGQLGRLSRGRRPARARCRLPRTRRADFSEFFRVPFSTRPTSATAWPPRQGAPLFSAHGQASRADDSTAIAHRRLPGRDEPLRRGHRHRPGSPGQAPGRRDGALRCRQLVPQRSKVGRGRGAPQASHERDGRRPPCT